MIVSPTLAVMLLGSKVRLAEALLTLISQVAAEATEAYRAIALSKTVEGNIVTSFRKREKK